MGCEKIELTEQQKRELDLEAKFDTGSRSNDIVAFEHFSQNAIALIDAAQDTATVNEAIERAKALKAAAKVLKDREYEERFEAIRKHALSRLAELMAAQRDAGLMNKGTAGTGNANVTGGLRDNPPDRNPTLAEAGIDKNTANEARKLRPDLYPPKAKIVNEQTVKQSPEDEPTKQEHSDTIEEIEIEVEIDKHLQELEAAKLEIKKLETTKLEILETPFATVVNTVHETTKEEFSFKEIAYNIWDIIGEIEAYDIEKEFDSDESAYYEASYDDGEITVYGYTMPLGTFRNMVRYIMNRNKERKREIDALIYLTELKARPIPTIEPYEEEGRQVHI
jgi:hypothetical protein